MFNRIDFDMRNVTPELKESPRKLRNIILEVVKNTSALSEEADTSPCSRVRNIEDIITRRLEFNIQKIIKLEEKINYE